MEKLSFGALDERVLTDVLAALPMRQVVRMARLAHARLARCCGAARVLARMPAVSFQELLHARLAGGDVAATFCSQDILKKLHGKIVINIDGLDDADYLDVRVDLVNQTPGNLHLFTKWDSELGRLDDSLMLFLRKLTCPASIIYVTHINYFVRLPMLAILPKLVYVYSHPKMCNYRPEIFCRPELLNGRHVVHVAEAVSPVKEAKMTIFNTYPQVMRYSYTVKTRSDGLQWCYSHYPLQLIIP